MKFPIVPKCASHEAICWKGDNLADVFEFAGERSLYEQWFASFDDYEKSVREQDNVIKVWRGDSHDTAKVGDYIVKSSDGYCSVVTEDELQAQFLVDTSNYSTFDSHKQADDSNEQQHYWRVVRLFAEWRTREWLVKAVIDRLGLDPSMLRPDDFEFFIKQYGTTFFDEKKPIKRGGLWAAIMLFFCSALFVYFIFSSKSDEYPQFSSSLSEYNEDFQRYSIDSMSFKRRKIGGFWRTTAAVDGDASEIIVIKPGDLKLANKLINSLSIERKNGNYTVYGDDELMAEQPKHIDATIKALVGATIHELDRDSNTEEWLRKQWQEWEG